MTIEEAIRQAMREVGSPEEWIDEAIQNSYNLSPELMITGKTTIPPGMERQRIEELKAFYSKPDSVQQAILDEQFKQFKDRVNEN